MSSFTDAFSRPAIGLRRHMDDGTWKKIQERIKEKTTEKWPSCCPLMENLNQSAGAGHSTQPGTINESQSQVEQPDSEMKDESGLKQEIKQESVELFPSHFPPLPKLDFGPKWSQFTNEGPKMHAEKQNAMEFNANAFDSTFRAPTLAEKDMFSTTDINNKFTILLYPKKLTIFPSKFSKEGEFRSFAYITLDEMRSRIKPRGGEWDMFMGPATVRGSLYPQLLLKIINAMHMNVNRLEIEVIESDFENGARTFKLTNQKDFC